MTQSSGHSDRWYEDFFDEWYLRYWVQWIEPGHTGQDADAIERFLRLGPRSRVLDLCCGQGRHSLELARRGYRLVGLDLSDTLLAEARRQAGQEGLAIEFVSGDMRRIPFENAFDGVFNFYTAFGYFADDRDNQAVLNAVAGALKPGGRFLLDYPCLEGRMAGWKTERVIEFDDGTIMTHQITHDVFDQTIRNDVLYITADNRRHRTGFTLRHYYGRELRRCLGRAGLDVVAVYGDKQGKELTNRDDRMLIVAQKTNQATGA
ncbi:MAG: class I SAM-dependent methyltransferase [Sedimentisphaerales bacterium]|nr:class I SAM-dependent methyltransferase [Sedimentisphaerales bacterium]